MKISKKESLILVDASIHLYRSYYAFSSLKNFLGESTGVIYGVLRAIKNLLVKYYPKYMAIIFDSGKKSFREKIYKNYKSCRPSMPNQIINQMPLLFKVIRKMGILLLTIEKFEADDVIGTLAVSYAEKGFNILINTCDKDISQLVSSNISIIDIISGKVFGIKETKLKFGIPSELIADFLALSGDRVDNIPGVPGIGKKTAQKLLLNIGGIKKIYSKIHNTKTNKFPVSNSVIMKLKKYQKIAFLSYRLSKIKTNLNISISKNDLRIKKPDLKSLSSIFKYNGFIKWGLEIESGEWLSIYK